MLRILQDNGLNENQFIKLKLLFQMIMLKIDYQA